MDKKLQDVRREVENLQRDEQTRLDREKKEALSRIQREVTVCIQILFQRWDTIGTHTLPT